MPTDERRRLSSGLWRSWNLMSRLEQQLQEEKVRQINEVPVMKLKM